jgi:FlaG/FlaF family flagellin (archaellin)
MGNAILRMLTITLVLAGIISAFIYHRNVNAATPTGQAVFDKLQRVSGINIPITVGNYPQGSSTDKSGIYIDIKDIKICNNDKSCIGAIVAHELGHHKLKHLSGNNYNIKEQEKHADLYAAKLTSQAGLRCSSHAKVFDKLDVLGVGDSPNYYSPRDRAKYIRAECAKYQYNR